MIPCGDEGADHVLQSGEAVHLLNNYDGVARSTLLATALIELESDNGRRKRFCVLMDQGAKCSFLSERDFKVLQPT